MNNNKFVNSNSKRLLKPIELSKSSKTEHSSKFSKIFPEFDKFDKFVDKTERMNKT